MITDQDADTKDRPMKTSDLLSTKAQTEIPALSDPIIISIEQYWRTLRHAQHIPARSALDPSRIDGALPYAFILQRVAPGTARFRVAGQKVHELLKMDARGMPFSTLFQTHTRDEIAELIETAFGDPAVLGLPLVSTGTLLKPQVHGAMILLPMQDAVGETNRLLGAFVTSDTVQSRPRRFEINKDLPIRHDTLGLKLAATRLVPSGPASSEQQVKPKKMALQLVVSNP